MPIEHEIDHEHRLVIAKGRGILTNRDVLEYQHSVWSRSELAGYDELIDMTGVERIDLPSLESVRELARTSAEMDNDNPPSRLAIVAPKDFAFALGRLYEAHRGLDERSRKAVNVFRHVGEALAWLGSDRSAT
jgi:hypothetical protein